MLIDKALNKFAKRVVKESKANLNKFNRTDTKKLQNSITYNLRISKNSFQLSFEMEDYGAFVDQGVKGKRSSSRAPRSPFKFGSGTGKKGGLTNSISTWIKRKGIKGRGKDGKFISDKSLTFLISRSIYQHGIKPSLFFTKPFEKYFNSLPDELLEDYALDMEKQLERTIDNIAKNR
jgi:hypothetical protein